MYIHQFRSASINQHALVHDVNILTFNIRIPSLDSFILVFFFHSSYYKCSPNLGETAQSQGWSEETGDADYYTA